MPKNNNNKLSRQQISGIGEAYRQITEAKMSIDTSSSATIDMGLGGKGDAGLGPDGKMNVYIKPNTVTGKPAGKGTKKAGYGFEITNEVAAKLWGALEAAGVNVDRNDPLAMSRQLNNLKGKQQQEVVDKVAKDFSTSVDRKPRFSDIQKAFDLMADYQREWGKKADAHEKKFHDAKVKVTKGLWTNPNNHIDPAVEVVKKWRELKLGSDAGARPGILDVAADALSKLPHAGDSQGAQAPGEPAGTLSPKEKRIANVKDVIQTKKLEKKGLFKPNTRDKVAKKLIKDVMRSHPEKGKPAFVATKGSKIYKEIIKKYGTELENNGGEYETANAGMPGPGDIIPNPSGGGLDWGNVDPNAGRQYKIPSGGIGRRAIDPGGNLGPDSWDIDPVTGGGSTWGGTLKNIAGVGAGVIILVGLGGIYGYAAVKEGGHIDDVTDAAGDNLETGGIGWAGSDVFGSRI